MIVSGFSFSCVSERKNRLNLINMLAG